MTLRDCYLTGKKQLQKAGIDSPAFDAMCLFERCFGMDRQQLAVHGGEYVEGASFRMYGQMISRRASGVPLQYLLGEWEFMGMPFFVGEGVLIPREDTQVLVEECASRLSGMDAPGIVDLCGGSGAVAIGLASLLARARVTSLELSEQAIAYLQRNIERNGMADRVFAKQADVLREASQYPDAGWDAVVSNPPYIPTEDLMGLQREVQFEPKLALDGGEDGLLFYRTIARDWFPKLKPFGVLAVEVGIHQAEAVADLFASAGGQEIQILPDLGGIPRVVSCLHP